MKTQNIQNKLDNINIPVEPSSLKIFNFQNDDQQYTLKIIQQQKSIDKQNPQKLSAILNLYQNDLLQNHTSQQQPTQFTTSDCDSNQEIQDINTIKTLSRLKITSKISTFIGNRQSQYTDISYYSQLIQKRQQQFSRCCEKSSEYNFRYRSELQNHHIKIFNDKAQFKKQFINLVEQHIKLISGTLTLKQYEYFQEFFLSLKNLNIDHPFQNSKNFEAETISGLIDKWLTQYQSYQSMILSFDFIFPTHNAFIIIVIFYWMKLEVENQNPLINQQEYQQIVKNRNKYRQNLLRCLYQYVHNRSREIINNFLNQQLLNQFCKHLNNQFLNTNTNINLEILCNRIIKELQKKLSYEDQLQTKINIGENVAIPHLQFIYQKYQNKDKFIEETLEEQVTLFMEIDQRNFCMTPLNRIYQTGQQLQTHKILASRHNLLTCWLLNLVLKKCKSDAQLAIKYCERFYELCKSLMCKKNYQRGIFFLNILRNIKLNLGNLWKKFYKFMEKKGSEINEEIQKISSQIHKISISQIQKKKQIIIFPQIKIQKIVLVIKQRHNFKKEINYDLHKNIQQFAKNIIYYRQLNQKMLINKPKELSNSTIKMNLNYRFLNFYIYEVLKKQNITEQQRFQKWKVEAKEINISQLNCNTYKFWTWF